MVTLWVWSGFLRILNTKDNIMTTDRIKEIQAETAYPNSTSVQQALLKVWNECQQEKVKNCSIPNVIVPKGTVCVCDNPNKDEEINHGLHRCTKCRNKFKQTAL